MDGGPIRTLLIVGGGSAGWMSAAALVRVFGPGLKITLVESEEIGTIGVGEATIPPIRRFNDMLRIDEARFLRETKGSIKLGIEFNGWGAPTDSYMHSFGEVGRDLAYIPFHHYWLLDRMEGGQSALAAYDLNTRAAYAGRFAPTGPDRHPLPFAFHFDAALYAQMLRGYAEAKGVERIEGRVVDVKLDGESGDVASVRLADGADVAADFFVDCSGFRGLLIEQALKTGYLDWRHWLPCDRAIAAPCARTEPLLPFTRSTAFVGGWRWRIPLQHRTGNGVVYSSAFVSDDEAEAELRGHLDGEILAEPRPIRFTAGRRRAFWTKNCVAVGLASGFLEPLESTSIHLIQTAIERLVMLFPRGRDYAHVRDEYNKAGVEEFEFIRDFIILHYRANQRVGEALWDEARRMALPDTLAHKIALYEESAAIHAPMFDLFRLPSWLQVLEGQNVRPRAPHAFARLVAPTDRARFLASLRADVDAAAARLPPYERALEAMLGAAA